MQVGPARPRYAESAGLGSNLDPHIPEAERSSATRGDGRVEPSDGSCAVTDPTTPEILAWLGALPLREQLVTLHAMVIPMPALQRSHPLKKRIAAIREELRPTAEELSDILTAGRSQAERLKEELAG